MILMYNHSKYKGKCKKNELINIKENVFVTNGTELILTKTL